MKTLSALIEKLEAANPPDPNAAWITGMNSLLECWIDHRLPACGSIEEACVATAIERLIGDPNQP